MALLHSNVPVSRDSDTFETEAVLSAVINFIIYTCAFLNVTCQNFKKGPICVPVFKANYCDNV